MAQKLILIRGNSGSGKSTVARQLRNNMRQKVMLLPQDTLRRDILQVSDDPGNPAIELLNQLALYGKLQGYDVIIEGILSNTKYGDMLRKLALEFDASYAYYLDISFDETLRRHNSRNMQQEFGETEMRRWWTPHDELGIKSERIFSDEDTLEVIVNKILSDINC